MAITEKLKTTPPPLICLAALLISLALNAIWPLVSIPDHVRYIAGSLLIFGSLLAMPSILIKFRRINTTLMSGNRLPLHRRWVVQILPEPSVRCPCVILSWPSVTSIAPTSHR
jgi:hypothetical protein